MQDVQHDIAHRTEILQTLIHLVAHSPLSVQEHDLQNSILPFLSTRETPVTIILVLRFFARIDMSKLIRFHEHILYRMYTVLDQQPMIYPELIEACVRLVVVMSVELDTTDFLVKADFLNFIVDLMPDLEAFEGAYKEIRDSVQVLRRKI
jgi:chorismate mutase